MSISSETLDRIDAVIARNCILTHPFYQAWQRGELSRAALQDYAAQYYHHVEAFPTYLSALHSHTEDAASRKVLLENLIDEERGDDNHPELWMRFAEGVGAERASVRASPCRPETTRLIESFRALCAGGSVAQGLSALYAYESQIPAVSETKIAGLRQHYGIDDARSLKYFDVHREADVIHSAEERALLARHIDEHTAPSCVAAAEQVTTALWGVLTGVCDRHGIA